MTHAMLNRTANLLAAAALAVFTTAPAAAGGSDPKVVIDEIFGQVDAMCGGDGQGATYDIYAISAAYFVPALAKPFEAAMEAGDLGFDVLVDAQDCQTSDLALGVVESGGSTATGRATFKNFGEARVVDLVMSSSDGGWKVTDIVYGHRPFSLKSTF